MALGLSLVLMEQHAVARRDSLKLYATYEVRSREWQQRQTEGVSVFWSRPSGPRMIEHCRIRDPKLLQGDPVARTRFAIVSLLTVDAASLYTQSAVKLARSVRRWLNLDQVDLVMMVTDGFGFSAQRFDVLNYEMAELVRAGWSVLCHVPAIEHPSPTPGSRFHSAKLYSKLNVWGLTEYDALLYMDLDTLIIREPTRLFFVHYNAMLRAGLELGAVRDRPAGNAQNFNAGVLLVIPRRPMHQMIASINTTVHEKSWAEQGLLNVLFQDVFYELPYIYNANLVSKADEPELWRKYRHKISIVHYTVSKGWESLRHVWQIPYPERSLACWWWGTDDFCLLWDRL